MEVCEVCGAFLIVGDAQSRVDDHLMGKQHMGYAKIKATVEELKVSRFLLVDQSINQWISQWIRQLISESIETCLVEKVNHLFSIAVQTYAANHRT